MNKALFLSWACIALTFSQARANDATQHEALSATDTRIIPVGHHKQLFMDKRFIQSDQNITLVPHPPSKKEIVLRPEGDEQQGMFWGASMVEAADGYLLYYGTRPSRPSREVEAKTPTTMHVARSADGLHWERIRVGRFDMGNGKDNNIVMVGAWGTVFVDPRQTEGYRFWLLGHLKRNEWWPETHFLPATDSDSQTPRKQGLYLCRSKDGINWSCVRQPVFPFTGDTRNQALFDPSINKYVAYLRARPGGHGSRAVARGEHSNLLGQWPFNRDPHLYQRRPEQYGWLMTELPIVMRADEYDPPKFGIYTPNVHIYAWAADAYIAFPDYYRLRDGIASHGRDERGQPANEGPLCPGLAVSRDGVFWHRFRTPYVPLGLQGEIDGGTIYMVVGMIRKDDEIWQYVSVSPHTHHGFAKTLPGMSGGILRLVQRLDGFVSAHCGPEGGEFVTPPIVFAGNRLELNADCSALGEIWVEIQDTTGAPIAGYTMNEAVSVDMNGTALEVWWANGPDLAQLAGTPVRLRFRMRSADLYAFRFFNKHTDN